MSFSGPMLAILMLFGGDSNTDLLDFVPADVYWEIQGVNTPVTCEVMLSELTVPIVLTADEIDSAITDLGSSKFKTRQAAQEKLLAAGNVALEKLKEVQNSSDEEVAASAKHIIKTITTRKSDKTIRRLMAIRTLGSLGNAKAVDTLKAMTKSTEPFEANYARRAIAKITKQKYIRPLPIQKQRMAD